MGRLAFALSLVALLLAGPQVVAQKKGRGGKRAGQGGTVRVDLTAPAGMHYFLFVPSGIKRKERYPLVLALHGNGEKAANRVRNMARISCAAQPVFVVAPQYQATPKFEARPQLFAGRSAAIRDLLEAVCKWYPIDRGRLFLQGFSMGSNQGSYLVWEWYKKNPKTFPFRAFWMSSTCDGGWLRQPAAPRIPYLLFCGDKETAVKGVVNVVKQVRAGYLRLFEDGYDVRYIEIAGMGHTVNRKCLDHMREQLAACPSYAGLLAKNPSLPRPCQAALDLIPSGDFAGALAGLSATADKLTGADASRLKGVLRKLQGQAKKIAAAAGKLPRRGSAIAHFLEAERLAVLNKADPTLGPLFAKALAKLTKTRKLGPEVAAWRAFAAARKLAGEARRKAMHALAAGALAATEFGRRARAHLKATGV